ncbi:GntR family transcriptional regulator [uncultured Sphaerochaeta sp.]|uniref:GntR family transcriptional regulator n=1 Tax=uncultured Sphaerochaeta sp. TaxID=886478 RepID=UPI002A0A7222|nr:GntR family transcriptional regulator [uncultured Sphaerochaeta sp.]
MDGSRKYQKLYYAIVSAINDGTYATGDKLPSESELATKHGISRQTVRQALNKLVNDGCITKVHGSGSYVSEHAIQQKKTMHIAVITTYISSYIFPLILRGIESVATENSYTMLLMATNNSIAKEREILQKLSIDTVDGILVEGTKSALPSPNLPFYEKLINRHIPLVFFNAYYPNLFIKQPDSSIYVVTDDYQGGYDQTLALIQKGHHAIGGIFKSDDIQGINRFSGYIAALADNNIPFIDNHCMWFTTESREIIARMLRVANTIHCECTALICYNDEIASQVLAVIKDEVHTITEIRSFDHAYQLKLQGVELHSLGHPQEEMGVVIASKLFAIIEGKKETNTVMAWRNEDSSSSYDHTYQL